MAKIQVINFNHISNKLSKEEIAQLKSYYLSTHRLTWAYKHMFRHFKRVSLISNTIAGVLGAGSIGASIGTGGIGFIAFASVSIAIKIIMEHKNLPSKI